MGHFTTIPGQTIKDPFAAFEDDGASKRSGLTVGAGDFIINVLKDCVPDALAVTITEIGATGDYCLEYTPPTVGYWVVEVRIDFSDDILCSRASVGQAADLLTVITNLERVLGLLHMNSIVDKQLYDANNQPISWRIRHFNTASNVPAVPDGNEVVGLLHEYAAIAEYDGPCELKNMTIKKVL